MQLLSAPTARTAFVCYPIPTYTFPCHCEPSQMARQSSKLCHALMRDFIMTGSPRSQCSPARIKSTTPSSPPLEGCRAAAGWSESSRKRFRSVPRYAPTHTPLSLRVKRSNPVNYARTRMRATLLFTGSPRSLRSLAMTRVIGIYTKKYYETHIISLYPYAGAWRYRACCTRNITQTQIFSAISYLVFLPDHFHTAPTIAN